jgi:hypothetical protein
MRLMTPTGRLASVGACRTPTTPSDKVVHAARERRVGRHAWSSEERLLRALPTNRDFTISVSVAVAIAVTVTAITLIQRGSGSASDGADRQEICR